MGLRAFIPLNTRFQSGFSGSSALRVIPAPVLWRDPNLFQNRAETQLVSETLGIRHLFRPWGG